MEIIDKIDFKAKTISVLKRLTTYILLEKVRLFDCDELHIWRIEKFSGGKKKMSETKFGGEVWASSILVLVILKSNLTSISKSGQVHY